MRDINRIPVVLSMVEQLWKDYPDMRFFQFVDFLCQVVNANNGRSADGDLFYLEDAKFIEELGNLIETNH